MTRCVLVPQYILTYYPSSRGAGFFPYVQMMEEIYHSTSAIVTRPSEAMYLHKHPELDTTLVKVAAMVNEDLMRIYTNWLRDVKGAKSFGGTIEWEED